MKLVHNYNISIAILQTDSKNRIYMLRVEHVVIYCCGNVRKCVAVDGHNANANRYVVLLLHHFSVINQEVIGKMGKISY